MRRTYVLDTCVLLADPHAPLKFDEHDVVIPLVVVEELDQMKTRFDEVGANARRAIRLLEEHGASHLACLPSSTKADPTTGFWPPVSTWTTTTAAPCL